MSATPWEHESSYISLYKTGELAYRARILEERLARCEVCPRHCGVNRMKDETGFCRSGYLPLVASFCDHHGEEPVLSGKRGSGTIFFANCNLKCIYCQNHQISQRPEPQQFNIMIMQIEQLAKNMLYLQDQLGCHNINLVSPSHFVPQIVKAVLVAVPLGLKVPLVYNSNAYDSLETLRLLEGIIDIYLPDLKYSSDDMAEKYSSANGYVEFSRLAIQEMYRQTGDLEVTEDNIAVRGLIIRHLILPQNIAGSAESLKWLRRNLSSTVTLSVMSQYMPVHHAGKFPPLSRKITREEYDSVVQIVERYGFENGWLQKLDSSENYLPDFNTVGHPFEDA
jgi:putative pyruvate formate lyase activating enzyme